MWIDHDGQPPGTVRRIASLTSDHKNKSILTRHAVAACVLRAASVIHLLPVAFDAKRLNTHPIREV